MHWTSIAHHCFFIQDNLLLLAISLGDVILDGQVADGISGTADEGVEGADLKDDHGSAKEGNLFVPRKYFTTS